MRTGLAILIIGLVILAAGLGAYATTPPSKGKLVIDWYYESSGHYPESASQAQMYKAQLERTGLITVNLHGIDYASYYSPYTEQGLMEAYVWGWTIDYADPDSSLYALLHSQGGSWLNDGYNSSEMDRLLDAGRTTLDPAQRAELYSQVQDLSFKDAPLIPVFQGSGNYWVVTKPDVSGVVFDVTAQYQHWHMITPPQGKDTLVIGTTDSIATNIDPAEDFGGPIDFNLIFALGAPLVSLKPGTPGAPGDFLPGLATNWSSSPDGLTWTFDLRQGVKFSDGTEFTAEAYKYSWDRAIGLARPFGGQVTYGFSDTVASVAAPSKYQLVFNLRHVCPWFLQLVAMDISVPVNPKYAPVDDVVNYVDGNARASHPNDLGPYMLTEWIRTGGKEVEMKLDANPNYFGAADGYPKAKHIIIRYYSDPTALALAMKAGDIDMASRVLNPTDLRAMESDPTLKVWKVSSPFVQFIAFNERIPPFDNPKVRQAISAALNRQELCDTVLLGQCKPAYSLLPAGMQYHKDVFNALGDGNINLAVSTFQELGYSQTAENPMFQTYLAMAVIGAVVAVVGIAMSLRRKSSR